MKSPPPELLAATPNLPWTLRDRLTFAGVASIGVAPWIVGLAAMWWLA